MLVARPLEHEQDPSSSHLPLLLIQGWYRNGGALEDVSELIASHSFCILKGKKGRPQKLTQLALLHAIPALRWYNANDIGPELPFCGFIRILPPSS